MYNEGETQKKFDAIEKTLHIMNAFADAPHIYSAKELSDKLGFSKPTVHRILNTLEKQNYVRRNYERKYTVGYKAYHVGMIYANNTDIYMEIRRVIEHIASTTGEQVGYAVLEGTDAVSVYESQTHDSRVRYMAGTIYPINSGCYGKILMSFSYTDEELSEIVPKLELKQVSPGAIMNNQQLLEEYKAIRNRGYAESIDEYLDGTVGLGVPVFRQDGSLAGCISLGALKSAKFDSKKQYCIDALFKAADELRLIFLE